MGQQQQQQLLKKRGVVYSSNSVRTRETVQADQKEIFR